MISLSLVLMVLLWNPRIPVTMARTMWAPGVLWICGIRISVSGADHLQPNQPYVFVSNHQAYLDIPMLFRAIPVNLYFVAKKELKKVPFLGWYMMATGMIFIDRTNRSKSIASLKRAAKLIHDGKNVIMFPEGTRSQNGQVNPFKKGPFVLAQEADVAVVPVGIHEANRFHMSRLGRSHYIIYIGKPLPSAAYPLNELIQNAHEEVARLSGRGIYQAT